MFELEMESIHLQECNRVEISSLLIIDVHHEVDSGCFGLICSDPFHFLNPQHQRTSNRPHHLSYGLVNALALSFSPCLYEF
jgi:hypothetical protein